MPTEPFTWNAVVVGSWNTVILSPDGIRRRLFDLADGTPIELEVAVDQPSDFRVGHDGLLVVPKATRLEVVARVPSPASLVRASALCIRALRGLPETPVTAVGVNVRYRFTEEIPDRILDLVKAPVDEVLSDAGFLVTGGSTRRTLAHQAGVINVTVTRAENTGTLEFNFHRDSGRPDDLVAWLELTDTFIVRATEIATTLGVADVQQHGT